MAPIMPLDDVRIIDLTQGIMGPFCTRALADYGADIVKVEPPRDGDPSRQLAPFFKDEPGLDRSVLFLFLNTSKRSITLDVASERGRQLLLDLVKHADAVIESFKPGTLDRLGLGYEELSKVNPRVVLTSITNFGQTGPYSQFEAESINAFGMGGPMLSSGFIDQDPLKTAGNMSLYQGGWSAALATVTALLAAEDRGEGEHIDVSLFEVMTQSIDARLGRLLGFEHNGVPTHRNELGSNVGSGAFPCSDGYVLLTAGPAQLPNMIRMIGMPELLDDPDWATLEARSQPERIEQFAPYVLSWTVQHTTAEVRAYCQEHGVLGGPMNTIPQLLEDQNFKERQFFHTIDHPTTGPLTYPGFHFTIHTDGPMPARRPAPLLGQHTDEVLSDVLGMSTSEIAALRDEGVI
jgi:crotonobetainyl-CoA:carnitine CoA-transferase CaiB-like acyl-CoA transferase